MQKRALWVGLTVFVLIAFVFIFSGDKESIETKLSAQDNTTMTEQSLASSCNADIECIPASCCHARSCVSVSEKPVCSGIRCTQSCEPDTLDCGQARCGCVQNKCTVVKG